MTETQQIRKNLYCSDCKNCKILVWNNNYDIKKNSTKTPYIAEIEENLFLIRCTWLKENVLYPLDLIKCEGFDSKNKKSIKSESSQDFDDIVEDLLEGLQ